MRAIEVNKGRREREMVGCAAATSDRSYIIEILAICVDSAQEVLMQVHLIERVERLLPVSVELVLVVREAVR